MIEQENRQQVSVPLPLGPMPQTVGVAVFPNARATVPAKVASLQPTKFLEIHADPSRRRVGPKDGVAFVYAALNGPRANANVVAVSALALDFDDDGAVDRVANLLRAAGLAGVVFSTWSSKSEAPRCRAVVPYSAPVTGETHRIVAKFVTARYGADGACVDPARLNYASASPNAEAAADARAVVVEGLALDGEALAAQASAPLAGRPARKKLNVDLDYAPDFPKVSAHAVADGCPQIAQFRKTGYAGKDHFGAWCAAVGTVKHTSEGPPLAHEWSAQAPEYSYAETQRKLDEMHNEGPARCETFTRFNPKGCQGCKFAGKITTPLHVVSTTATTQQQDAAIGPIVEKLLADYFVAPVGGKAFIFPRDAEDVIGAGMARPDFKLLFENRTENGKPVADQFLKHPDRCTYSGISFNPQGNSPADKFELWRGWAFEPVFENAESKCRLLLAHIREVLCSGCLVSEAYLLNWIAFYFQFPWKVPRTALVLKSDEGTGKTAVTDILLDAAGRHGFTSASKKHILGDFNGHLLKCVVVVLEEALFAGDPQAANAIKPLITNKTIGFEPKGKPAFTAPNRLHFAILTNNQWAVPADAGSRRYFVPAVSDHRKGDTAYFTALFEEIENGGKQAFMGLMMRRDISKFNPDQIPTTRALQAQKYETMRARDSVAAWWAAQLEQGGIGTVGRVTAEWPSEVGKGELAASYADDAGKRALRWADAAKRFRALVPTDGFRVLDRVQGHGRWYGYALPNLTACRAHFEKVTGVALDVDATE